MAARVKYTRLVWYAETSHTSGTQAPLGHPLSRSSASSRATMNVQGREAELRRSAFPSRAWERVMVSGLIGRDCMRRFRWLSIFLLTVAVVCGGRVPCAFA